MSTKSREELEELKANWLEDPCWDIETTNGFEEHEKELKDFRHQKQFEWDVKAEQRLIREGKQWGLEDNRILLNRLLYMERRINDLEAQIERLVNHER